MSGKYIQIKCGLHTDPDFDGWTFDAVGLYIYLFTNEHVHGLTGISRVSKAVMLIETKLTPKRFDKAVDCIGAKVRWFGDGTYWVVARSSHCCYKSDGSVNDKLASAIRSFMTAQPREVYEEYAKRYRNIIPYPYPTDTLSGKTDTLPIPNREQPTINVDVSVPVSVSEDVYVNPPTPLPVSAIHMLCKQMAAKINWPGGVTSKIRECVEAGLREFGEGGLSAGIEAQGVYGMTPWDLLSAIRGPVKMKRPER